jgi:hypothetical protein
VSRVRQKDPSKTWIFIRLSDLWVLAIFRSSVTRLGQSGGGCKQLIPSRLSGGPESVFPVYRVSSPVTLEAQVGHALQVVDSALGV